MSTAPWDNNEASAPTTISKREAVELLIGIKRHFESQTKERTMPSGEKYVPKQSQIEYHQRLADQAGLVLDFMFQ